MEHNVWIRVVCEEFLHVRISENNGMIEIFFLEEVDESCFVLWLLTRSPLVLL